MKTQHTPGPWKACRHHEDYSGPYFDIDEEGREEYHARPFVKIESANGYTVTSAHDLSTMTNADAALIAAAPELLAALVSLHDDIQDRQDDGANFNPGTLQALEQARIAIAKAQPQA